MYWQLCPLGHAPPEPQEIPQILSRPPPTSMQVVPLPLITQSSFVLHNRVQLPVTPQKYASLPDQHGWPTVGHVW
jgi:hypothetical protein